MASTDAKPVPQKNVAYRVTFPILDADGDLVTGATGLDSEISKDAGTFADVTAEATEIATASGMYFLDLTATEMNADTVSIIVKTTSAGAKTTAVVMYPEEAGDIRVNVTAFGGTAGTFASGRPDVNTTHAAGTAWNSGGIGSATFATGAITATAIAADAIGASELAADAVTEIANAVWDTDATARQTQGTFGQAIGDPGADTNTIFKAVVTDAAGATVGVDVVAVQADTDNMQTRLPAALVNGLMDSNVSQWLATAVGAATAGTPDVNIAQVQNNSTAATSLSRTYQGMGANLTADSGTTTTLVDAALTQADTDSWKGSLIVFSSGTLQGQVRLITAFDPTTDTLTFTPATTQAVSTHTYAIIPAGSVDVVSIAANAVNASALAADAVTEIQSGLATAAALATVDGIVDDILLDTAEIGAAGAGLTDINLPNQTMDIVGNITGNLSGSVGSVTGAIGSVTGNVSGNVTGSVGSLAAQAKADVNAEVVDGLNVDTYPEPGQGTPAATASLSTKIGFLHKAWRNRSTMTSSEYALYSDDATTKDQEAVVSDDAVTFERGEVATGA